MNKDVLLSIRGTQMVMTPGGADEDTTELLTGAQFRRSDDACFFFFEEYPDGQPDRPVKSRLTVRADSVNMRKTGALNHEMNFRRGQDSITEYETPMGVMELMFHTTEMDISISEDLIRVKICYEISAEGEILSYNTIDITAEGNDTV